MPTLPPGTVTLLFTDIEGSTRLLQDLGEAYEQVLTDHRELLSSRFEEHGGVVVDTQGDAFFVAFARARDAVTAAVEAQRALAAHEWPSSVAPRVRMAIHTGEPARVGEGLVGVAVHRAARICGAGHGGQVLLSSTTRDLVDEHLLGGVVLIDLGEHRLKDLDRPERIAQLVIEGVPPVLTPLKSLAVQPEEATLFAGREQELAEAARVAVEPAGNERTETRALWGAAARTRALDWRHLVRLPGRSQLADRIEGLGLSIHATARIAPSEDLQFELRSLGRALVVAARDVRGAAELLRRENSKNLSRRLADYRERTLWDHHLRAADTIAEQIAALTTLAEAEEEFEGEARKLEPRVRSVRGLVFDARHDPVKLDELMQEMRPVRERVESLVTKLHVAYRSAVAASETAAAISQPSFTQ
jgi:class 3 adenylate cyclase